MSEIVNKYKFGLNVIKKEIKSIPVSPGIYKMIDENGEVLYVGKAKNLKKRIILVIKNATFSYIKTLLYI